MGMFADLKSKGKDLQGHTGRKKAPYVTEGRYLWKILAAKQVTSHDGAADYYIIEVLVVDSDGPDANAVGTEPSIRISIPGKHNYGLADVNKFLLAAMGSLSLSQGGELPTPDDITAEVADYSYSSDNPLAGQYILGHAFKVDTKTGGKFTVIEYSTPANAKELFEGTAERKLPAVA